MRNSDITAGTVPAPVSHMLMRFRLPKNWMPIPKRTNNTPSRNMIATEGVWMKLCRYLYSSTEMTPAESTA